MGDRLLRRGRLASYPIVECRFPYSRPRSALHALGAANDRVGVGAPAIFVVGSEALAEWSAQRRGRRERKDGKRCCKDMGANAQHRISPSLKFDHWSIGGPNRFTPRTAGAAWFEPPCVLARPMDSCRATRAVPKDRGSSHETNCSLRIGRRGLGNRVTGVASDGAGFRAPAASVLRLWRQVDSVP